ncbi:hypothetical protein AAG570_013631 [Ranatra chinensis]|uniref:Uncharacterized protein n=1 Tax=Ranatra chinensis TaxID=642074 RepID=A0ABD0YCS5_9HEMI
MFDQNKKQETTETGSFSPLYLRLWCTNRLLFTQMLPGRCGARPDIGVVQRSAKVTPRPASSSCPIPRSFDAPFTFKDFRSLQQLVQTPPQFPLPTRELSFDRIRLPLGGLPV